MVDAVASQVLVDERSRHVVNITNVSDGTGETDITKIDKSDLKDNQGQEPAAIDIDDIQWSMQGFTYVVLEWRHGSDRQIAVLSPGQGWISYSEYGGKRDPASDGTGDVALTTVGAAAGATYDITISARLRQSNS